MIQLLGLGPKDATAPAHSGGSPTGLELAKTAGENSESTAPDGFAPRDLAPRDFASVLSHSIYTKEEAAASFKRSAIAVEPTVSQPANQQADTPDYWLSLIEELQTDDAATGHLADLAAQHGLTIDGLKSSLQEALDQLDAVQSSHLSTSINGKELPEDLHVSTTAAKLSQLLEQGQVLELDDRLSALLESISELPDSQQLQVQAQLTEFMRPAQTGTADASARVATASLTPSSTPAELTEPEQLLVEDYRKLLATHTDAELIEAVSQLSDADIATLRALVNAEQGLQSQQADAADSDVTDATQRTALQHALAQLVTDSPVQPDNEQSSASSDLREAVAQLTKADIGTLRAILNAEYELQSQQAGADDSDVTDATQRTALQYVLAQLVTDSSVQPDNEQAQSDEGQDLEAQLTAFLSQLSQVQQTELSDAERARVTEMEALLADVTSKLDLDVPRHDVQVESPDASTRIELTLNALLTEIRQLLSRQDIDARPSSPLVGEGQSALSPAAQALSQVAQQLRELLQGGALGEATMGDKLQPELTADGDLLRRIALEATATTHSSQSDGRSNSAMTGMNVANLNATGVVAREAAQTAASQQSTQSAFETARQAQQAVDILGTNAPEQLRERVAVMFNTRTQAAEIRLDPPDLGRLNIRLSLNQDQAAAVSFQVSNGQAREALEQSLPRLREMLAEQGIQLADANVSEQRQGQAEHQHSAGGGTQERGLADGNYNTDGEDIGVIEVAASTGQSTGRVDYFV